jgi:hypothetical protein
MTQRHRQTHVSLATTRLHWTQRQWDAVFFLLMKFVFMGFLQMDAVVFGEDELSGFVPKTSFNVTAMLMVGSRFGIKSVITVWQHKPRQSEWNSKFTALL